MIDKIRNISDFEYVKKKYNEEKSKYKHQVLVCSGTGCKSANCYEVKDALIEALKEHNLEDTVFVKETGCNGICELGPIIQIQPDGVFYNKLKPKDISPLIKSHLIDGNIVMKKTYFDKKLLKRVPYLKDIQFFKAQLRIVLRNCGNIDHSSIYEYIANDGYKAIYNVLTKMSQVDVIEEIKKSGLRGRGGGGFPTGIKWEAGNKAEGDEKYIICNADEGDPGAFMDRSIIEGDPHSVIEGMMIGGYAIGAKKGFVYIRAEYPLAVERLENAITKAREIGLLGKEILGSEFSFDIEIRIGGGSFVCGEETALMLSIEGKRGEPRQKPPFPFQRGLFSKPTIINNVETLANISPIIIKGSNWFAGFGTEKSKGTKVFALAGDINNTGLVEVPMGMTLRDIIFKIGGGISKGKEFKAAQIGGPSGGCITSDYLDTPVDYDSLTKLGAIMGSGGLIIMNNETCMVDIARFFMDFCQDESCGKCAPCRLGTKAMLEILERIVAGDGIKGDIEVLENLAKTIKDTSLCGLGQTAPNPVLSTINYFRSEFEEHINDKHCSVGGKKNDKIKY